MIVAVKNSNYSCFQSLYTQCFLKIVYLLKLQLIENLFWQIFEKWGLFKVYFSRWYTVCCGTGIVILAQDSGFAIRVLQITLTNSAEYYIGRKKLTRPLNLHCRSFKISTEPNQSKVRGQKLLWVIQVFIKLYIRHSPSFKTTPTHMHKYSKYVLLLSQSFSFAVNKFLSSIS